MKLRDIDHTAVQAWVSWLANDPAARQRPDKANDDDEGAPQTGLSASRMIQAFQVLDQVMRFAIRSKYIAINPAGDVQQSRKSTPEKIAHTHAHVRELAEAAGELATMVYVLGYAGLRFGECAALRVGDVGVQKRRLRVSRSVTYVTGKGQVEGGTKTHASRMVPVPSSSLIACRRFGGQSVGGAGVPERRRWADAAGQLPMESRQGGCDCRIDGHHAALAPPYGGLPRARVGCVGGDGATLAWPPVGLDDAQCLLASDARRLRQPRRHNGFRHTQNAQYHYKRM